MLPRRLTPSFIFSSFSFSYPSSISVPSSRLANSRWLSLSTSRHQQQTFTSHLLPSQTRLYTQFQPSPRLHSYYSTMATTKDVNTLADQLKQLGIDKVEHYPNCHPETNPIDIYRSHITGLLHEITGIDTSIIYPAIQWTQSLDKGDAIVAVPALRVKGKKPNELAEEWVSKVGSQNYSLQVHI